jgi:Taurine catabolism dioxygenase TauD, TfdA family
MIIVAFDETHRETWTIDRSEAIRISRTTPAKHFYGHLTDILSADPECKVVRITQPWSAETLDGVNVMVIARPAAGGAAGCDGERSVFSAEEKSFIRKFLEGGGGLLVATEDVAKQTEGGCFDLCEEYRITFKPESIVAPRDERDCYLLVQTFDCQDVARHELTEGVSTIRVHKGCSLEIGEEAVALVRAPGKEIIAACSNCGAGRIVAIGDSDIFSIPHIGASDNLRLFCNAVYWLAGKSAPDTDGERARLVAASCDAVRNRPYAFFGTQYNRDLGRTTGPHVMCFDEAEQARLASGIEDLDPYRDIEAFLHEGELKYQELPRAVRASLNAFRRNGNEYGGVLIRNLPIDRNLPDTPPHARRAKKDSYVSEMVLATFSMGLGELFSYKQEKDGDLFHNVCPTAHNTSNLSSESSEIVLDFHTETAFHPHLPDFVLLLCLRADHAAAARTEIASIRHMVEQIPLRYIATLFEPVFVTGIDYSFGSKNGLKGNGPAVAVLYGDKYDPFMKYDLDLMVGKTRDADAALQHMKRAANACKNFAKLTPGDLLIIDNRRSVHARSRFVPKWDGQDRWLQRTYVIKDLRDSEEIGMARSRLIDLEFRV